MERINITKDTLLEIEQLMRLIKHLDRYFSLRQFCFGHVLDIACGVGYGTYILSTNPDVQMCTGVDISSETIDFANQEYKTDKTEFVVSDINSFVLKADMLISLETIEHLDDPAKLADLARRCMVDEIIISYPTKKSTHFNPYHKFDLVRGDIIKLFSDYLHYDTIELNRELEILFFIKNNIRQYKEKFY